MVRMPADSPPQNASANGGVSVGGSDNDRVGSEHRLRRVEVLRFDPGTVVHGTRKRGARMLPLGKFGGRSRQTYDSTKYDYDCIGYTKNSESVVTTRLAMIARDVFLSETSSRR
jgi:hypothetical protein